MLRVAIGDSNYSLEYYYYVGGALRRAFHFREYGSRRSVLVDTGTPFRCESLFRLGEDPEPFMWAIVDEVGINPRPMVSSIQTYSKPYKE